MSQPPGWVIPVILVLVIALAAETAVIFFLIIEPGLGGSQTFPRIVQAGCSTLTSSTVFSNPANRTLLFECSGVGSNSKALIVHARCTSCPIDSNPYYEVYRTTPTFTMPTGYLALWLTVFGCSDRLPATYAYTYAGSGLLTSGQEVVVGGYYTSYNYCAVVDNTVSHPSSFAIEWSPGTPPVFRPAPFVIAAYPTSMTIPLRETGNFSLTVTSLGGWMGNVTIDAGGLGCCTPYTTPTSILVKGGGSNTTTLSVPTCEYNGTICTWTGSYTVGIHAAQTDCLSRVQGICFDQYNSAFVSVKVDVT